MDFWDLVHPTMRDAAREQGAERLRGEVVPVRNEVKLVTKSGDERWVEFAAAMIRHGGTTAVVGTAFDITERRRAQAVQRDRLVGRGTTASDAAARIEAQGSFEDARRVVDRIIDTSGDRSATRAAVDAAFDGALAAALAR